MADLVRDGHNWGMVTPESDALTVATPSAQEPLAQEPVAPVDSSAMPGVAVAVVARRLGVAPATLRTWDRRYGLGPSERSAGSHRRYTRDDVLRLMVMRRLTLEGVAPGDAARAALQADLVVERALRANAVTAAQAAAKAAESEPDAGDGPPTKLVHFARPTLVPNRADTTPSDVVDAALSHDSPACVALLAIEPDGDIVEWWTSLVAPSYARLANRTVLARPGEAPVQILKAAAMRAIREQREAREEATGTPHPSQMPQIVLVFTAPDEPHQLPTHALAAALGAHGVMARIVTGPANAHRAQELVSMVRPAAVVLMTELASPELGVIDGLLESQPRLPIFVSVSDDKAALELPMSPTVVRVRTFSGLFHEVLAVAASGR